MTSDCLAQPPGLSVKLNGNQSEDKGRTSLIKPVKSLGLKSCCCSNFLFQTKSLLQPAAGNSSRRGFLFRQSIFPSLLSSIQKEETKKEDKARGKLTRSYSPSYNINL